MKKFKKLLLGSILSVSLLGVHTNADAATNYQVKSGDTFWKIATRYGVTINSLKAANHRTSNMLYSGESIVVPASTVSDADKTLMARLVQAEAKGEPYAGKVAVATVVLNRVDSPLFPNTIKGVILQRVSRLVVLFFWWTVGEYMTQNKTQFYEFAKWLLNYWIKKIFW